MHFRVVFPGFFQINVSEVINCVLRSLINVVALVSEVFVQIIIISNNLEVTQADC